MKKMKLTKVLCVIFILFLEGGEGRIDENDSKPENKRRTIFWKQSQEDQARKNAIDIVNLIGTAIRGFRTQNQFGYIYLQPDDKLTVKFDNKEVSRKMNTAGGVVLQPNQYVWPPVDVGQTNFRMAGVAPTPARTSYGHSERLLLSDNDLERMVLTYKGGHNGNCPSYILFYSTLLPCIRPPNPDGSPRCAQMVIDARQNVREQRYCPQTPFYLYSVEKLTPGYVTDKQKTIFAQATGIIPLNPIHRGGRYKAFN